jgi:hypothetical protein
MKKKTFSIIHTVDGYDISKPNTVIVYAHTKFMPINQKYAGMGALFTISSGLSGRTYAIPFWNDKGERYPLEYIRGYVDKLYDFACSHNWLTFCVGNIGIGVYGYMVGEVAPLFRRCMELENFKFKKLFLEKGK